MHSLLILIMCFGFSVPYPAGAPDLACAELRPQHDGSLPQQRANPYNITITQRSPHLYQITLAALGSSPKPFRGYLIAAINTTTQGPAGIFTNISSGQNGPCFPHGELEFASITHAINDDKTSLTAMWMQNPETRGEVCFKGAVVANQTTWWTLDRPEDCIIVSISDSILTMNEPDDNSTAIIPGNTTVIAQETTTTNGSIKTELSSSESPSTATQQMLSTVLESSTTIQPGNVTTTIKGGPNPRWVSPSKASVAAISLLVAVTASALYFI